MIGLHDVTPFLDLSTFFYEIRIEIKDKTSQIQRFIVLISEKY